MKLDKKNNYLAVSDALLTITMLSNNFNEDLDNDSSKIIDFIFKSFEVSNDEIEFYKKKITDDLTIISTTSDVDAFYSNNSSNEYPEIDNLLYLKCQAISKLNNLSFRLKNSPFQYYFDYNHLRPYFPHIRFYELESVSIVGDIDINRTVAILQILGIGCEKNQSVAINRLKQCALWGDISSLFYLSYLNELIDNKADALIYRNLSELSPYMLEGKTILSDEDKNKYNKETNELFVIITSIKQDIILAFNINEIDFSFVEVILLDNIDYYTKMECINNYKSLEWKEITNSSYNPSKKLGFKI